ncbi:LysM peptidoglycan-binding domain-containing protein [Heyndrickxia sp. NPDC080065]|uniref:LysM peptidoglycan-binding domain-containing protein n=1 Tax=Heyndrickxia sp. NPDC080065 TaxID=3390568 RepID=UPI003CFDFA8A
MKKAIMSIAATTIITSAFAPQAFADTYKVKKGDSLWSIANKYSTSTTKLKELNKLKSDMIYPNQVLTVKKSNKTISAVTKKPSSTTASKTSTYKVKAGDNLSKIASKYKVTVTQLKSWNKLKTTVIYPGDVLKVSKPTLASTTGQKTPAAKPATPSPSVPAKPSTPTKPVATPQGTYIVKSGDTLGKISLNFGMSVADLKKLNKLTSDMIYIGQSLIVKAQSGQTNPPKVETPAPDLQFSVKKLVDEATKLLGTPYEWGGSTIKGFDCSGFIYYVFGKAGVNLPRTSSEGYYSRSYYVKSPQIGDLVFFADTYKSGISHLGIYVGNNQFIHAGDNGVQLSSLNNSYWKSHFDGYKRLYELD